MSAANTNVVSIAARWSERRDQRYQDCNDQRESSDDRVLTAQLRDQNSTLDQAIVEIELARDRLDLSAAGAAEALRRFEQSLSNLRLSLTNQRSAAAAIENAAAAGEAAARVKALMLDVAFDRKSVLRHDFSSDVVLRVLSPSEGSSPIEML
jgi:hypothetical protein